MSFLDEPDNTIACHNCKQVYHIGGMRPAVVDGMPIYRCRQCYELFVQEELAKQAMRDQIRRMDEAKDRAEERRDAAIERTAAKSLFQAYEAADMEAVADEITRLFQGNAGLAQAIFSQWVQASAMKPGSKQALELLKLMCGAIHTATMRRPPKTPTDDMSDEEIARELASQKQVLQIRAEGAA